MIFSINEDCWEVIFVNPGSPTLEGNLGITIPEIKKIYIVNSLDGNLLHKVLCHELTHAEFSSRGIMLPDYLEEVLADIIADNIVDVGYIANNLLSQLYRYDGLV